MKRIGLLVGVLGGVLLIAGCDEVKRRATDTVREVGTHALDQQQEKAKKLGDDAVSGKPDDASDADKKRNKLKGDEDSDK
jgi:hypothetical protein